LPDGRRYCVFKQEGSPTVAADGSTE